MDDPSRILDFWHNVELLSPQSIPKPDERGSIAPVFHWQWQDKDREPLSWQPHHLLNGREKEAWNSWSHTVFAGVFEIERWRTLLEERLGSPKDAIDSMPAGQSCLFTFTVSDEGRPIPESFCPSAAAWAFGRTVGRPGPAARSWLEGFSAFETELTEKFDRKIQVEEVEVRRVVRHHTAKRWHTESRVLKGKAGTSVDPEKLRRMLEWAVGRLGVRALLDSFEFRIESRLIDNNSYFEPSDKSGLLNSFFIKDLDRLRGQGKRSSLGAQLSAYLGSEIDRRQRKDLVHRPDLVLDQLRPSLVPKGKWPIAGHFPLVASQQVAVNSALEKLRDQDGLFSVNGPPGTGKTTLLRDLVAAILVDRADQLVQLEEADDAFTGKARWKSGDYTRVTSILRPELTGHEIVIASSNNGAVENISLEIPALKAVDKDYAGAADPFREFGSRLLGQEAWALLAGKLGNRANCYQFCSRLIERTEKRGSKGEPDPASTVPGMGLRQFLRSQQNADHDWQSAKQRYLSAVEAEQRIRTIRSRWAQSWAQWLSIEENDGQSAYALEAIEQETQEARGHQATWAKKLALTENQCSRTFEQYRQHRELRPGLVQILLSWGKALAPWNARENALAEIHQRLVDEKQKQEDAVEGWGNEVKRLESALAQSRHELARSAEKKASLEATLDEARGVLGEHFPAKEIWQQEASAERRELSSPWADREWRDARVRVFIEAIQLHRAFVLANADRFRMSFDALADILRGNVPSNAPEAASRAAWQALFFVVPVVSTTFASVSRLFSHLKQADLGWLLVDEAGQATPQAAVGALWRTRRSVIVGDPLQLEPIVTLPFRLEARLQERTDLSGIWLPSLTSVQVLADRVNSLGTDVRSGDSTVWIGCPLRVHRRCDNPMFEISNRVAYGNLMVRPASGRSDLPLPESQWIHVMAQESEGHWIPAEGRIVRELLLRINSAWQPACEEPENIFLLSPFRQVVSGLQAEIGRLFERHRPFALSPGTVHTAQGKESNVVIFVLGGDPNKQGAKAWAASKPNLLNVAVSRAKRRLYVVGNHDAWSSHRYFGTLASLLPRSDWSES